MFTGPLVKFSIPSKTFLLGEYVALDGGPALVLGHAPFFESEFIDLGQKTSGEELPFHPESPAGIWADIHEEVFAHTQVRFTDPYLGAGGFGASTAQFLSVYFYVLARQNMLRNGTELSELQKWAIVEDYRQLFEEEDVPPSGYDLMAQMHTGLSFVMGRQQKSAAASWPFKDMDIFIYKTEGKIKTHEHLKKLDMSQASVDVLSKAVQKSMAAMDKADSAAFINGVQEFTVGLQKAKLVAPQTLELMQQWRGAPGVLATKGCGALGADVFAVFCEKSFTPSKDVTKTLKPVWSTRENNS